MKLNKKGLSLEKMKKYIIEYLKFYGRILPIGLSILVKSFFVYAPIVLFWALAYEVDFNGALFVSKVQEITKENILSTYQLTGITLSFMQVAILTIKNALSSQRESVISPINLK